MRYPRLFVTSFLPIHERRPRLMWGCALGTMLIGNLGAFCKPMSNACWATARLLMPGYVMVALAAASSIGVSAAMFYLVSYALMNIGAFAVIVAIYMREPDVATMQLEAPPFSLRLAMWVNAAALR